MNCDVEFLPCSGARPGAAGHLVMLPGWAMPGAAFAGLLPVLREHFHLTVIDLPGSAANAGVPVGGSLEAMASTIADAAPLHASWIGWSLGGMVAACIAANEPQRVQSLVTIGANLTFVQRAGWQAAMPEATFDAFERDVAADSVAALQRFLGLQCQGAVGARDDLRLLRELVAQRPQAPRAALLDGLAVLRSADLRHVAADIRCPSLWIYGERDALVPAAAAEGVARRIAGAQATVLPGIAHVPFFSGSDALRACLGRFPGFLPAPV
ncbi:MAG: alpha/beta fold hydrolase [Gammaproteobacteria bacterium]